MKTIPDHLTLATGESSS